MRFFALFALVAIAEMATFFWVEARIGLGWALGLALATAIVGSLLVRRAGVSVLRSIQHKFREGSLPGRELSHGAAILVAGAFLISPGFITDTLGFILLIPATRDGIHGLVSNRLKSRMTVVTTAQSMAAQRRSEPEPPAHDEIIDVDGWE